MSTDDGTTTGGTKDYINIVNGELYIILLLMLAGSVGSVHGSFVASAGPCVETQKICCGGVGSVSRPNQ